MAAATAWSAATGPGHRQGRIGEAEGAGEVGEAVAGAAAAAHDARGGAPVAADVRAEPRRSTARSHSVVDAARPRVLANAGQTPLSRTRSAVPRAGKRVKTPSATMPQAMVKRALG